jgi:hypothetical protein
MQQAEFSASQNSPSLVAPSPVDDLVALGFALELGVLALEVLVLHQRLCGAHGLQELRPRRARLRHDVELAMAPVARHLPAARVGVLG